MYEELQNTGKRDAVRNNSGEPVDHSGPGLGRANTLTNGRPKAGGLPSSILPERRVGAPPSQPKSGPEVQEPGGFLGAGEARPGLRSEAEQPTFLDQDQINRNSREFLALQRSGRRRFCGIWTVSGVTADGERLIRVNCKTWGCAYCGPRKAKRYRYAIREIAERERLNKFLTLTLDPRKIEGNSVRYLRKVFDKFRVYLRKLAIQNGYTIKYIAILEFQKNGNPHLHVLLNQFIPQAWISQSWSSLGGGYIVDIRYVDVHRVSRYLSKYLTKELLLSAPDRSRRVTTSRSIRLLEKTTKEHPWNLIRMSIFALYTIHHLVASAVTRDEEDFLESFLIAA